MWGKRHNRNRFVKSQTLLELDPRISAELWRGGVFSWKMSRLDLSHPCVVYSWFSLLLDPDQNWKHFMVDPWKATDVYQTLCRRHVKSNWPNVTRWFEASCSGVWTDTAQCGVATCISITHCIGSTIFRCGQETGNHRYTSMRETSLVRAARAAEVFPNWGFFLWLFHWYFAVQQLHSNPKIDWALWSSIADTFSIMSIKQTQLVCVYCIDIKVLCEWEAGEGSCCFLLLH